MEYEFRREAYTGNLLASFSMGQEIVGFWFVEELGESTEKYQQISQAISQLRSNQLKQWNMTGKALSLELTSDEAHVYANELETEESFELEDAMSLYDGESEAFSGLEDFHLALQSWRDFIEEG